MREETILIDSYYKEKSLVQSQLDSFNYFIEEGLRKIIENFDRSALPDNLSEILDEINLEFNDIELGEPVNVEVDGSVTDLTPQLARIRGLTYGAPLYLYLTTKIGSQTDKFRVQIANVPIMLKSNKCVLTGKNKEELTDLGEDPDCTGGYFIIDGTERVVVYIEDLALNKFFVIENKDDTYEGRMFSERGVYKNLQSLMKKKDGSYIYNFSNFKGIPLFLLVKVLGIVRDKDIIDLIGDQNPNIIFQLSEYSAIQTQEQAMLDMAKFLQVQGNNDEKIARIKFYIDNFVLPHIGFTEGHRIKKGQLICKLLRKYVFTINNKMMIDDKDHLMNKRLKLVGDLFGHFFKNNFTDLVTDILTNFQRAIKRGRFSNLRIIIREQLLTQKLISAMATGNWSDGRSGVSQYLKRENYLETLSHLTRVVSPLSSAHENSKARELNATHYGRMCVIETPEGHNIGLRLNMALMARVTHRLADSAELDGILQELNVKSYGGDE